MPPIEVKPGGPVRRLRLRWERGELVLADQVRVSSMTLPPHQPMPTIPEGTNLAGFWFEATSGDGEVLYRRFAHNPLDPSVESFDEKGVPSRRTVAPVERLFDVLIPDHDRIEHLRVFVVPNPFVRGEQPRGTGAVPFAEFDLSKLDADPEGA